MRRWLPVVGAAVLAAAVLGPSEPAAADYEYTAEAGACGHLRSYLPLTGLSGRLPDSYIIRGPAGALFGRTFGAVRSQVVWWDVPMSDGARVQVHRHLLPALRRVEQNLAAAADRGLHYPIRRAYTFGFLPRTSVAHDGISHHGIGAAIDINAHLNPYRSDGVLVTNMPDWFVEAFEDAGMCWGGSWVNVKDAMHFSWNGPKATHGFGPIPAPLPPLTTAASFTTPVGSHEVVFGPAGHPRFVDDVSGDGAPDVVQVRPWDGTNSVLEAAISRRGFEACGVWRWWLGPVSEGTPALADVTGAGRPDLVYLDTTGEQLVLSVHSVTADYAPAGQIETGAGVTGETRFVFGDFDGDGADDLWQLTPSGTATEVTVWSAASDFTDAVGSGTVMGLSLDAGLHLATADRDVDGREDLLVVDGSGPSSLVSVITATNLSGVAEVVAGARVEASDVVGFPDYDGDGRPDLMVLGSDAGVEAWRGNSSLGGSASGWFLPADFECPEDTVPYHHLGLFADDDTSEFEASIEWLAARDVTRGCNPPFQDRFCPEDPVTRGQMAAFLTRALGLAPGVNRFLDDDGSVFEADIAALAASGITRGCNPPVNDRFCPNAALTRGQMAAFLHRAQAWLPDA